MAYPSALVGYTGFVGGNLAAQHTFDERYDVRNIAEGFCRPHDLVVYAGVPAEKFLANTDPAADMAVIDTAWDNLCRLRPQRVVLISTVDVYGGATAGADENAPIPKEGLHPYGADRLELERRVREGFADSLVVRLPALFGKGLKKNFLYDLCHITPSLLRQDKYQQLCEKSPLIAPAYRPAEGGFYRLQALTPQDAGALRAFFAANDFNALSFTDSRAAYQFYSLEHLWADISRAAAAGLRLVNITSEPMTAGEVFRAVRGREWSNLLPGTPVHYDLRSCHCAVMGGENGYLYSAQQVLPELVRFVKENS